jgi:hypothetical protein
VKLKLFGYQGESGKTSKCNLVLPGIAKVEPSKDKIDSENLSLE